MRDIKFGNQIIGPGHPCFIIAEAGVNHNGDLGSAKQLVDAAVEAGADAVKFQTFKAERVVSVQAPKAMYQLQTTDSRESQLEMLQRLELSAVAHQELYRYCQERGIEFLSTPFDADSVDFLDELGIALFKVGSGDVTTWLLLEHIASKGKPIVLSTGLCYLSEVDDAVRVIQRTGNNQLVLLHCVTNYPADPVDTNLRAMDTMAAAFQVPVGYSDHTSGIEIPLAAVARGACVIEKHFTLDRSLPGPDHRASLEPDELRAMVRGIRTVEKALGDGIKRPGSTEIENRLIVRRSLAAACAIQEGTVLEKHMLQALRPAQGIAPSLLEHVVGLKAKRSLESGELIAWKDLA